MRICMTRTRTLSTAVAATALLLAACGGGGGGDDTAGNGNSGGDGGATPGSGSHTLTVQVQGLPEGATLPLTHGGGSANLTAASASTAIAGNNYALALGKLALSGSQPYLVQCAFAEPLAGALQSSGSLQVALNADATQLVQCQQKVFAALQASKAGNVTTPVTGAELITASLDGSQADWLPARLQMSRLAITPVQPALLGNELFLSARDSNINSPSAFELRATDGTEAGTRLVKDIAPASLASSKPFQLTVLGDRLYFAAAEGGDSGQSQLWLSDGTEAGTQKVLLNGSPFTIPENLTVAGGKLYFKSQSKVYAIASAGAAPIDLGLSTSGSLYAVGNRIYLNDSNGKQWFSDGTAAGTQEFTVAYFANTPIELGGKLYFSGARSSSDTAQLWTSDGTDAGTRLVKAIIRLGNLHVLGDKLAFTVNDRGGTGSEFWTSDGTEAGTQIVKDAIPGSLGLNPTGLETVNGKLIFLSQEGVSGGPFYVWTTDGTADGTHRLSAEDVESFALTKNSAPYWLKVGPDRLLFTKDKDGATVGQVWITDGTKEGTQPLRNADGQQVEVYSAS